MGVNSRQLGQVRFSPMDNSISSIQFNRHKQMETDRVVQKQAQGVPAWCWQTYKIKCVITAKQVFQASIQVKEII